MIATQPLFRRQVSLKSPVKPLVKPLVKPPVKPTVKPTVKPPVKPLVKPPVKPSVKPTVKSLVKPTVKPPVKPPVKSPVKPPAKSLVNLPVKPLVKPSIKPPAKIVIPDVKDCKRLARSLSKETAKTPDVMNTRAKMNSILPTRLNLSLKAKGIQNVPVSKNPVSLKISNIHSNKDDSKPATLPTKKNQSLNETTVSTTTKTMINENPTRAKMSVRDNQISTMKRLSVNGNRVAIKTPTNAALTKTLVENNPVSKEHPTRAAKNVITPKPLARKTETKNKTIRKS